MKYTSVKIPKPIARQINELIDKDIHGYASVSDFVLDATRTMLRHLTNEVEN